MPSQSPINGSTKYRTRQSEMIAGGSHQRHVCQKTEPTVVRRRPTLLSVPAFWISDVFVVRGIRVNELSFDRTIRPLHHFYAISLRIVLNFVHDVVDEEHPSSGGSKQIGRVTWIRNLVNVETFAFVFNGKTRFFGRQIGSDLYKLCQVVLITVLDC